MSAADSSAAAIVAAGKLRAARQQLKAAAALRDVARYAESTARDIERGGRVESLRAIMDSLQTAYFRLGQADALLDLEELGGQS